MPPGYPAGPPGYQPMMPVMFAPPRKSGVGRLIVIGVLTIMLLFSGLLNLVLLVGMMGEGMESAAAQKVLVKGDAASRIAVVPLSGMLMDEEAQRFARLMDQIEADASVKGLVVDIDTPGGSVTASDEIYHRLRTFKQNRSVPVVIAQGALATSGGYYVSCAGDYVFAQPSTLTGNIGVVMPRYNFSKLADKWGIEDSSLHSTGSDFKTVGSPLRPETAEQRQYIQDLTDQTFALFQQVVKQGRAKAMGQKQATIQQVSSGKAFTAGEALKLGLIDQIGYRDEAYAKAATLASLSKYQVVRFEETPSLLDLLSMRSGMSGGKAQSVSVNGANINVDGRALREWLTPRMMYLWMGE